MPVVAECNEHRHGVAKDVSKKVQALRDGASAAIGAMPVVAECNEHRHGVAKDVSKKVQALRDGGSAAIGAMPVEGL